MSTFFASPDEMVEMANHIGKVKEICTVISEMLAEISLNIRGLLTQCFLSRGSKLKSSNWLAIACNYSKLLWALLLH